MELLGLIYGMASVVVPMLVLSTTRAAVEYRSIGIRRRATLQGAVLILLLSLAWSLAAGTLLLLSPWSHGAPFQITTAHALLGAAPVLVGWIPGLVLIAIGAGATGGTLDTVPRWAHWMDALWTA